MKEEVEKAIVAVLGAITKSVDDGSMNGNLANALMINASTISSLFDLVRFSDLADPPHEFSTEHNYE